MIDGSNPSGRRLLLDLIQVAERQEGRLPATRRLSRYDKSEQQAVTQSLPRNHWSRREDTVAIHVDRIIKDEFAGDSAAFLQAAYTATDTKPVRKRTVDKSALLAAITGADSIAVELRDAVQSETSWIRRSLNDGLDATLDRLEQYQLLTRALPLTEETPYRAAVQRILGRSHALDDDAVLRRAVTQHVVAAFGQDLEERDAWLQAGINREGTPPVVLGFGHLTLKVGASLIEVGALAREGIPGALTRTALQRATVQARPKWALFIENPATWLEASKAVPANGLIILTDGMPSRAVRTLSQLLADVPRYHWGDVDVGGFTILRQLEGVKGLLMDEAAVRSNQDRLHPFTPEKLESFERRLERHPAPLERNALKTSLELEGWLEQEAIPAAQAIGLIEDASLQA